MLALAMERWNLHRRIALVTVLTAGTSPGRLVGGFMLASAFLSMWISNTATTVMLLPIGLSLVGLLSDGESTAMAADRPPAEARSSSAGLDADPHFATCLMLGIAYAASIGGMATLIGTPPNLFMAGFVHDTYGLEIGFARWTAMALPLSAVFLFLAWVLLTRWVYPVRFTPIAGGRELIRGELAKLGRPSRGEWTVLIVFSLTAVSWIVREPLSAWPWLVARIPAVARLHDAQIALAAALALFLIPVDARRGLFALDWPTAKRLPWGLLLLFGGGLSLAAAFQSSGLTGWIGHRVAALGYLPPLGLIVLATVTVLLLTELTSNLATASAFLPILGGVAVGIGMDPMVLIVPAGLAASCAFMMPVATPPNAIVFGSGYVTIGQMVKAGLWLNLVGLVLIVAIVQLAAALGWAPVTPP
jgi:sodium-dependent dicarboxylate transporter 2/3/5